MPLAFRASTEAGTGSAATSLLISVPSGVADDDHLVLFGVTADGDDGGFDALTGWTEIRDAAVFNTGGGAPSPPGMSVWTRRASSEPANYTITPTFGSTGICAKMIAFSGGDLAAILDVTETIATGDGSNANPPTNNSSSGTDGFAVIVAAFWDSTTSVFSAVPSGYTDPNGLADVIGTGGGNGCSLAIAYRTTNVDPAAAEDPAVFTSSAEQWGAITISLRPVTGPTISDVDTDEIVDDKQTGVVVTGTLFGATDTGSADLELGDSSDHATANLISQTRTGWSATSITGVTIDLGSQSPGLKYFFVTDSTGDVGSGFAVTVHREHELRMIASANIAASGENTTFQLTAPSGKTTGDFDAGRIQDDENPADTVDITLDDYTEMEWCFELKSNAPDAQAYVFRVTKNGTVIDTYTVTPQITVSAVVYTPLDLAHRPHHQPILAH